MTTAKTQENKKGVLSGTVVSDKMTNTVVVAVESFAKHPKYEKFIRRTKRIKAHNPDNKAKMGDKVEIIPCRPMSKDKHYAIVA